MDDQPWFRRFGLIGFYPIHWKGLVTIVAILATALAPMVAADLLLQSGSLSWWVLGGSGVVIGWLGIFFVWSHMED